MKKDPISSLKIYDFSILRIDLFAGLHVLGDTVQVESLKAGPFQPRLIIGTTLCD